LRNKLETGPKPNRFVFLKDGFGIQNRNVIAGIHKVQIQCLYGGNTVVTELKRINIWATGGPMNSHLQKL
jgi:hypothetical protein